MQKIKPFRSKKYLKAVSELPCCICGLTPCDPHHIKGKEYGGMALKPSDNLTMPLCHDHHTQLHAHGYKAWEMKHGHQVDHVRRTQERLKDEY